jgi:hypothetical protein
VETWSQLRYSTRQRTVAKAQSRQSIIYSPQSRVQRSCRQETVRTWHTLSDPREL